MNEKPRLPDWGTNFRQTGSNLMALRHLVADGKERRGHKFLEIRLQWKDDSLLVILKKDSPKGPEIAFIEGDTLEEAVYVMAHMVKSKTVPWKQDKWKMREVARTTKT